MAKRTSKLTDADITAIIEQRIKDKTSANAKVTDQDGRKVGSVKLRHKPLTDGRISLYLDIYMGGKRSYDFLNIYIDPQQVKSERDIGTGNENAILEAEKARAAKAKDMAAGKDVQKKTSVRSRVLLSEWMREFENRKRETGRSKERGNSVISLMKHLKEYNPNDIEIGKVDTAFCEGFIRHLSSSNLSVSSQKLYYTVFKAALNEAVEADVIETNPTSRIKKSLLPKPQPSNREYLDVDELRAMIATDAKSKAVKMAYLFSCFCGLRISDVRLLTWGNIVNRNGVKYAEIIMKKTNTPLSLPLPPEALRFLPERGEAQDTDKIFTLPSSFYVNYVIRKWTEAAGVKKHLSFHTARHTFATMELTFGADLYTTSKLLGHTDTKTTEIYAKIVDRKKEQAVSLLGRVFDDKGE